MARIPKPETMDVTVTQGEVGKAILAHHAAIEAKTDAVLAATERQIAALRDLKHTAIVIAAALIVAGYVIVKVL